MTAKTPTYPVLGVEEFGRQLVDSLDLDPIYVAHHALGITWNWGMRCRWLVAYWCFYHAGVASFMAEREERDFWRMMKHAAANSPSMLAPTGDRWPRAKERRHFRGDVCVRAVQELSERYPSPESMVAYACREAAPDLKMAEVSERVQEWPLFGPWIAFKVGDMLDRCLGIHVDFDAASVFMFKDPTEAALMVWRAKQGLPESARPKDQADVIDKVVAHVLDSLGDRRAPPSFNRPCSLQEAETVLCKWKSHTRGHYPLHNDLREIAEGLEPWCGQSQAAFSFYAALPKAPVAR